MLHTLSKNMGKNYVCVVAGNKLYRALYQEVSEVVEEGAIKF